MGIRLHPATCNPTILEQLVNVPAGTYARAEMIDEMPEERFAKLENLEKIARLRKAKWDADPEGRRMSFEEHLQDVKDTIKQYGPSYAKFEWFDLHPVIGRMMSFLEDGWGRLQASDVMMKSMGLGNYGHTKDPVFVVAILKAQAAGRRLHLGYDRIEGQPRTYVQNLQYVGPPQIKIICGELTQLPSSLFEVSGPRVDVQALEGVSWS